MTGNLTEPLSWMDVVSTDLERSVEFYRQVFAWQLGVPMGHHGGEYRLLSYDGDVVAGAEEIGTDKGSPRWTVFVSTTDMARLTSRVVAAGGKVTFDPQPLEQLGVVAMIQDPLGSTLGVWEPWSFDPAAVGMVEGRFSGAELSTSDIDVTSSFLRDALGWTPLEGSDERQVVRFSAGAVSARVTAGTQAEWVPILHVPSIDRTIGAIRSAGGTDHPPRRDGIIEAADPMSARFLLQSA